MCKVMILKAKLTAYLWRMLGNQLILKICKSRETNIYLAFPLRIGPQNNQNIEIFQLTNEEDGRI